MAFRTDIIQATFLSHIFLFIHMVPTSTLEHSIPVSFNLYPKHDWKITQDESIF